PRSVDRQPTSDAARHAYGFCRRARCDPAAGCHRLHHGGVRALILLAMPAARPAWFGPKRNHQRQFVFTAINAVADADLRAPAVIVEMHQRELGLYRLVAVLRTVDEYLRQAHPMAAGVHAGSDFNALIGAAT